MEENIRGDARILWRFLAPYKKEFRVTLIVALFGALMEALIPYFYGKIVAFIVADDHIVIIFKWLLIWMGAQALCDWTKRYIFVHGGRISTNCVNDFVLLLNRHSISLRLDYHNKNKSGKLSSRYTKAAGAMENLLDNVLFWFGADLLTLLCILLLIGLYVHWLLLAIILISIAVFTYNTVFYSRDVARHITDVNASYEEAYGMMQDSISNIKLVKASSGEQYENSRVYGILHGRTMEHFEKFWKVLSRTFFLEDTTVALMIATSLAAIIFLKQRQEIDLAQIVTFIGYLGMIRSPLNKIGNNVSHYRRWMATIRRGYSLLEEEAEDYDLRGKIRLDEIRGEVEFKDVSFSYNETREVLHGINLKVRPGEIVALVGESGVGKSTLVDLIPKYIIPTEGRILLDGTDIRSISLDDLRHNIAVVPQDVSMFNDTIRHNLTYGKPDASEEEIENAISIANAKKFICEFPNGLEEQVGERGVQLSGGQKQRIAIARAILRNPRILILDEATSALDSRSESLVQEAMNRLMQGRTTFIIAHRLSTIIHADRIVVLDKGRIVEQGTHAELLAKRGSYYKLYTLQSLARDKRE